jgi:Zn-dependent protease with chaperone function
MDRSERERGEAFHELVLANIVVDSDGWAFDLVHRVADRLQAGVAPDERMEPVVAWLSAPTAFVVPGRYIYFSRGLLQLGLEEEATALVFAHELAHRRLGHLRTWLAEVPVAWVVGVALHAAHSAFVSPDHEAEADRWALERCVAAGYDRRRCLALFDVLERVSLDVGDVDGVFGPDDPEKLAEARLHALSGEAPAKLESLLGEAKRWVWQRTRGYPSLRERRAALEHVAADVRQDGAGESTPLLERWKAFKATR